MTAAICDASKMGSCVERIDQYSWYAMYAVISRRKKLTTSTCARPMVRR